jgi:hypothetical protein
MKITECMQILWIHVVHIINVFMKKNGKEFGDKWCKLNSSRVLTF